MAGDRVSTELDNVDRALRELVRLLRANPQARFRVRLAQAAVKRIRDVLAP